MVQIIQENRKPTLAQQFGQAIARTGQAIPELMQQRNQQSKEQSVNKIYSKLLKGEELSAEEESMLSPELQLGASKLHGEKLKAGQLSEQKIAEKVAPLQSGLSTVQRMRKIGSKGRLGRFSSLMGIGGGKTSKDRGEYEQLGKSLISLSTNIPIRNRIEFETLAENLYNPSLPDKEREGILDAMERIISNSLNQYKMNPDSMNNLSENQERPPLTSFYQ